MGSVRRSELIPNAELSTAEGAEFAGELWPGSELSRINYAKYHKKGEPLAAPLLLFGFGFRNLA